MDAEKYVAQVVKHLNCPGGKKREIKKQIMSDIQAAMEEGNPLGQVIQDMGEPKELAAEFNESFSEKEKKAAVRAKRWRILAVVLAVLSLVAAVAWWALPKMRYLSDSRVFSEDEVRGQAEQIIDLFNAGDYPGIRDCLSEQMQEIFTEDAMVQAKLFIGPEWGEMNHIGNTYLVEISQMGRRYARAQMTVSYEKVSVVYTMSFDTDMKLAGFYLK